MAVIKGGKEVAIIDKNNSFIGELSAILNLRRIASVKALENSIFIVIPQKNFRDVIVENTNIAIKFIYLLAERLKNTADSLLEILLKLERETRGSNNYITFDVLIEKSGINTCVKILERLGVDVILNRFCHNFNRARKRLQYLIRGLGA